jgi:hypothetical protein
MIPNSRATCGSRTASLRRATPRTLRSPTLLTMLASNASSPLSRVPAGHRDRWVVLAHEAPTVRCDLKLEGGPPP